MSIVSDWGLRMIGNGYAADAPLRMTTANSGQKIQLANSFYEHEMSTFFSAGQVWKWVRQPYPLLRNLRISLASQLSSQVWPICPPLTLSMVFLPDVL